MGKHKDLKQEVIAQIVGLHKAGHPTREIVREVGVCERSVRNWVKKFKDGGGVELPGTKVRVAKPRTYTQRTLTVIKRQLEINPTLTARSIKENNPILLEKASIRTVNRIINNLGYRRRRATKKPILSHLQRRRRVHFAKKYGLWNEAQWTRVLWSDESTFTVTCNRATSVFRKRGSDPLDPRYTCGTVKHPDSLMVWGCFGYYGVGELIVLPKNEYMNQYNYLELLCDHLPRSFHLCRSKYFMQDGAPCHTAKSVVKWLDDCCIPFFNDWPGNSPDLNPIENLWSIIKRDLGGKDISSVPRLEAAIRASWESLLPSTIRNLCLSLPNRLAEVRRRKGRATKY